MHRAYRSATRYLRWIPRSSSAVEWAGLSPFFCTPTQYFERDGAKRRLSRRLLRDVAMRCAYNAPQLTTFVVIERACFAYFRKEDAS